MALPEESCLDCMYYSVVSALFYLMQRGSRSAKKYDGQVSQVETRWLTKATDGSALSRRLKRQGLQNPVSIVLYQSCPIVLSCGYRKLPTKLEQPLKFEGLYPVLCSSLLIVRTSKVGEYVHRKRKNRRSGAVGIAQIRRRDRQLLMCPNFSHQISSFPLRCPLYIICGFARWNRLACIAPWRVRR